MESLSHLPTLVIFLLLLLLSVPSLSFNVSDVQSEGLSVPSSVFNAAVKLASLEIRAALALVAKINGMFDDFRDSTAIADCVSLLDFSFDELAWTIDAIENPMKGSNGMGTGNPSSDLRTWLSAALGNQDTCLDGFERTNGIAKRLIAGSLSKVSSLVLKILTMVKEVPRVGKVSRRLLKEGFPDWMPAGERRMLQSPAGDLKVNLTVAQDGTGDFSTVMEAVNAAPEKKGERFVIYVKKGVYKENVEITKKKWNIMMVGEGMGVTVISGSRNVVDGWTTFRSATFTMDMFAINQSLAGIEKLNGSNYGTWKRSMDIILGCMDYDFVLSKPKPATPAEDAASAVKEQFKKWEKINRLTIMIIRASVNEELSGGIPSTETAAELIEIIKKQFIGTKKSLQITYLTQIMNLKYDGNGSVHEHILKLSKLVIGLRETGLAFEDELLVHIAVISLSKSFDTFKINYNTQEINWDLNKLISQCVTEEERVRGGRKESAHLAVRHSSRKYFKNKGIQKKKVWKGKKTQSVKGSSQLVKKNGECWFCQKSGHFKKDCHRYKRWLEKNP